VWNIAHHPLDTNDNYYMPAEELEYLEDFECSDRHACGPLETTWSGDNLKATSSWTAHHQRNRTQTFAGGSGDSTGTDVVLRRAY